MSDVRIETLSPDSAPIEDLVRLLRDAVDGGASLGFMNDMTRAEAEAFWRGVIADVEAGSRAIWLALEPSSRAVVGSVQLAFAQRRNGLHRAEVQKLLVLRERRRRGIASELLRAAEDAARRRGLTLLHLDTSEGPGGARGFYGAMGYSYAGGIPGYALDPGGGAPVKNAIYYKSLSAA
jgi:acetyltransferase